LSTPDAVVTGLREIEVQLRRMIDGDVDAYIIGWNVWEKAFSLTPQSPDLMWPLWLMWGAYTDWVEVKPEEKAEAEIAMRRAASEWLGLAQDAQSRKAYFDRWLKELGII
jgi:hypothetical protein